MRRNIAVIDIGKTNAKLALVRADDLQEIAVVTRPNKVLAGPPYPHFDLAAHWQFFLTHLRQFHAEHGVDAISVTTHGASGVMLDENRQLATPMLDYEYSGPDDLAAAYDAQRPDFSETGSPRLPGGLNLGAQFHWLLHSQPGLAARVAHVLTYPQYWGLLLTGELASDVTSLGCHTDLWNPWSSAFSSLVDRLGLTGKFAPPRRPGEVLGPILPEIAQATGLSPDTLVTCGIHDSNASLYAHVLGRKAPFSVVSTGTWVISMAIGGAAVTLDPARDTLVNVNAMGQAVPSARFMGGREFELIRAGSTMAATPEDRDRVLRDKIQLLPAVEPGSGPFARQSMRWTAEPANDGEKLVALSYYLALMTQTCLQLIGAEGPVICEGPFARNPDYLAMLAALRPMGVEIALSATGTSVGAALLTLPESPAAPLPKPVHSADQNLLQDYARYWTALTQGAGTDAP